jgi:hypothetical protein
MPGSSEKLIICREQSKRQERITQTIYHYKGRMEVKLGMVRVLGTKRKHMGPKHSLLGCINNLKRKQICNRTRI